MPDDFDAILDRCLADTAAGRETIDTCQRRYPAPGGQLAALLQVAEQIREAPPLAPLPLDKRRVLESRLLRRAGQLRSKPAFPSPVWRRRVVLAAASIVVVFLLLGSAVSVSAASVPGDILYPVKRVTEQMRLTLASQQQRVNLYLEFAGRRLQEMRVVRDRGEVSTDLLAEITGDTALALEQMPALPQPARQALLISLAGFEEEQLQVLEDMVPTAQGEARAELMAALSDSTARHRQAVNLLAGAAAGNAPAGGSSHGSSPAGVVATRPAQGHPVVTPESTDSVEPQVTVTPRATRVSPSNSNKSTPKMEHTPPGQARQTTPQSPPGQVHSTPEKKQTPPGQESRSAPQPPPEKPVKTPKK
jgi:hypothetical protein